MNHNYRRNFKEVELSDDDYVKTCDVCNKKFIVWMGASVVECPHCGKWYM